MINLSNLKFDIKKIDHRWIFSHYLKIPIESFQKRGIKILSPFTDEKVPSFSIYKKNNNYYFKDFSSGKHGNTVTLVAELFGINEGSACAKIVKEYNEWIIKGGQYESIDIPDELPYIVNDFNVRKWNSYDKGYWLSFEIDSRLLEWGLVYPLSSFTMNNGSDTFYSNNEYMYGYFNRANELVKIYQPMKPTHKFITVKSYVAGSEHEKGEKVLLISSSWKDALSIWNMGIKVDIHVHNSERSTLHPNYVKKIKKEHPFVLSILDNDKTGIDAMKKYEKEHEINYVYLPLEKDVSDSVYKYGKKYVKRILVPIIDKQINK